LARMASGLGQRQMMYHFSCDQSWHASTRVLLAGRLQDRDGMLAHTA
jgi:hypothetical protein